MNDTALQAAYDARHRFEALMEQLGALLGPEHDQLTEDLIDAASGYYGGERRLIVSELQRCLPGVAGAIQFISDDLNQRLHED